MTVDRQTRVRTLYAEALALPRDKRAAFVAERAGRDSELREEVERLLAQEPTDVVLVSAAELHTGAQLGVYVLEERIGSGGMGDVFRARDTRLDRRVAIKRSTIPFDERFEREAKALSALNHPNICTLFDVGPNYLVMELIDGETLAERIARGAVPRADVVRCGTQIADALAEAHRAGIVHRDLKPQNVMVTRHGIKVLDFGIAKRTTDDSLTRTGALIGTAAYLAPEQLAGEPASQLSDLYSLGVVLHELLTRQRPLPGSPAAQIASAATKTGTVRRATNALEQLIARLLRVDPAERPASAAAVADELRAMQSHARPLVLSRRALAAAAVAAAAGVVAVGVASRALRTSDGETALEVVRLTRATALPGIKRDPAYSPDGALAFVWDGATGAEPGIYVLRDGGQAPFRLTAGATDVSPAWAPDGRQVAFLRVRPGSSHELMTVTVPEPGTSARPVENKIRDVQHSDNVTRLRRPLLAWAPDGAAVVVPLADADSGLTSLYRVPVNGSAPRRVVASRGGQGDSAPAISSDGRWLAYADLEAAQSQLYIVALTPDGLAAGERRAVPGAVGAIRSIAISPDGQRVLWNNDAQFMQWERASDVTSLLYLAADGIHSLAATWRNPAEPLVVFANLGRSLVIEELPLRDGGRAAGSSVPIVQLATNALSPALSPDGRWLAFQAIGSSGQPEIWLAGPRGENPRAIGAPGDGVPILWSPDSRHIAYHARAGSTVAQLFVVDVDERGATSPPRQITAAPFSLFGADWSRDGRYLYSSSTRNPTATRIVRVSVTGGELEELFEGGSVRLSPDGKKFFYSKQLAPGLYERSAEGDVTANVETRVIEDYAGPVGFVPSERGIFYMGRDAQRRPAALRFFDFELRQSFDLGPPPQADVPTLTVSADSTRLLFEKQTPVVTELTQMQLKVAQ